MKPLLLAGLALLLGACDLQGLDLNTPSDARRYVRACARGADAVYCRAMQRVLAGVEGDVTVLLPNTGDMEVRAALEEDARKTGRLDGPFETSAAGEAYARANIFLTSDLRTGTMTSLDGRAHDVICQREKDGVLCVIDNLIAGASRLEGLPGRVGSIYAVGPLRPPYTTPGYLPF